MAQVMKDVVTWLKQWFYTESEVDTITGGLQTQINNKADTSTVTAKADKSNGASQITDGNANTYTNISTSLTSTSTQADINSAINVRIGKLMDLDWIVVVSTLPTASASTMGKLYLVAISGSGDNNFKEYVTVKDGTTTPVSYSWEKLGEISGSGLSVDWSDITNKPSSFTPSSHTHDDRYYTETEINSLLGDKADVSDLSPVAFSNDYGDLSNIPSSFTPSSHTHGSVTNDGKIGSDSGKIITTGTGGVLQASASITKSLISDFPSSMTPSSHTHGQVTNDGKISSTAVTVASGDNIVITDASDSSKLKRVANLLASHITDGTAHSNIGSSANDSQATINSDIDTALSNKISKSSTTGLVKNDGSIDTTSYVSDVSGKADKTSALGTTITLVNKGETNEGCIIFNTIS